jgi:hypothetical protein
MLGNLYVDASNVNACKWLKTAAVRLGIDVILEKVIKKLLYKLRPYSLKHCGRVTT